MSASKEAASASGRAARPAFRTDIEGLRGVAVLLVVLYHAGVPGFGGGYVGVDVFFALSGYLITGILAAEVERTGRVDFVRFYARRARRLLPASAVMLAAIAAAGYLLYAPLAQGWFARTALWTAAYLSNMHFGHRNVGYLDADADTNPLLHTWSLAVEEQFYLVWPVLVVGGLMGAAAWRGGGTPSRRRLTWTMGAVAAGSFALTLGLMATGRESWAFFFMPARAWEFALGGVAALVPLRAGGGLAGLTVRGRPLPAPPLAAALGWAGLAAVVASGALYSFRTPFPGVAALAPVVGTVVVLRAGSAARRSSVARALSWRPLREAGRLSYSWYLWHWPVLVFAAGLYGELSVGVRVGLVVGSLGLAEASYRLVENPVRYNGWLAASSWRGIALLAAVTAVSLGASAAWVAGADRAARLPEQQALATLEEVEGSGPCVADPDAPACTPPSAPPWLAVVLGDSHANQWTPALEAVAEARGGVLVNYTRPACPPFDVPLYVLRAGGLDEGCVAWRAEALRRIERLRPDVVVLGYRAWYPGQAFEPEAWAGAAERVVRRVAAAADRVVVVLDNPKAPLDVGLCLSREAWQARRGLAVGRSCDFRPDETREASNAAMDAAMVAVARRLETVAVLEAAPIACPDGRCRARRDGMVVYADDNHLTRAFTRRQADVFERMLGP